MHDPMTVAFEIKSPIKRKSQIGPSYWRNPLITIWHVDPEKDGSDDSCDWFGSRKTKENGWWPVMHDDYSRMMPDAQMAINFIWFNFIRNMRRPWYKHPRWHFWHWKIQIHLFQDFKRWAFSKCYKCGKRFSWGFTPISNGWNGEGPRWFRSEDDVYHSLCDTTKKESP